MKRIISVSALLLIIACILAMSWNWREAQKVYTRDLFAMDTFFSIKVYGPNGEDALEKCVERVGELEGLLSVTKEGSDIWNINHQDMIFPMAEKGIPVSSDTYFLIRTAMEISRETGGALDITLYPVLREWGFTTGEYQVPEVGRIRTLLESTGFGKIELEGMEGDSTISDSAEMTVRVPGDMELDLGAVAKGYTGDCLLEIMRDMGVTSALLDLGGNVQTLGAKPDGSPWYVAVRDPFDRSGELGVLKIIDKAVVTSGSYERYFTGEDGRDYWHILDPADGYPADNGLVSVTVVGDSGVWCDGLSTALFVLGKDGAVEFYRRHQDFEMLLVTGEGRLYVTEGISGDFECGGDWDAEIVYRNVE